MKILLTGATGFIGQNLVPFLLDRNFKISTIVRQNSNLSIIDKKTKVFIYNENIIDLIDFFTKEKFDGIVHLATHFVASHSLQDIHKLINSNIKFGTEILQAGVQTNVKWFLNVGTFWQNYHCNSYKPANLYAATKEAFQTIAKYYTETSDLIFTTLKLNDTFGKNDTRKKLIYLWNKVSLTGEKVDFPKGEQIIDICYIEDVVHAFEILINKLMVEKNIKQKNKTFILKSPERVSLKELAKIYEKATDRQLNINWGTIPYRKREIMVPLEKGEIIPEWKPKYTLQQAFKKLVGY